MKYDADFRKTFSFFFVSWLLGFLSSFLGVVFFIFNISVIFMKYSY